MTAMLGTRHLQDMTSISSFYLIIHLKPVHKFAKNRRLMQDFGLFFISNTNNRLHADQRMEIVLPMTCKHTRKYQPLSRRHALPLSLCH